MNIKKSNLLTVIAILLTARTAKPMDNQLAMSQMQQSPSSDGIAAKESQTKEVVMQKVPTADSLQMADVIIGSSADNAGAVTRLARVRSDLTDDYDGIDGEESRRLRCADLCAGTAIGSCIGLCGCGITTLVLTIEKYSLTKILGAAIPTCGFATLGTLAAGFSAFECCLEACDNNDEGLRNRHPQNGDDPGVTDD